MKHQLVEHGSYGPDLKIEETGDLGYLTIRSLERHFFGVFGHLGGRIDGWQAGEQLANYWRDLFGIRRQGETFPAYQSQEGQTSSKAWKKMHFTDGDTTDAPQASETASHTVDIGLRTPRAIMQWPWCWTASFLSSRQLICHPFVHCNKEVPQQELGLTFAT